MIGFLSLSLGSFVQAFPGSEYGDASGQAVGKHIVRTKRNEHMVVAGIGGNRMGGARRASEGAGYRRRAEGRHQLLKSLIARADDAEDPGTLSGQRCAADDLGRTQRAGRGGGVVISVAWIERYLVAGTDAGHGRVNVARPGVDNDLDRRRGDVLRRIPSIALGVKNHAAARE